MEHDAARQSFFAESEELLREMEEALAALKEGGNAEGIHRLFRAAHTIKGNSRIFPFPELEAFAHRFEEVLDALRAGRVRATAAVVELLHGAREHLESLVGHAAEGTAPDERCTARGDDLAARLRTTASATAAEESLAADAFPARWRVEWGIGPEMARRGRDPLAVMRYLKQQGCVVAPELYGGLPGLAQLDPERCYLSLGFDYVSDLPLSTIRQSFEFFLDESTLSITRADERHGSAPASVPMAQPPDATARPRDSRAGTPPGRSGDAVVRVDAARLEQLVALVGELVIANAATNVLAGRFGNEQLVESNSAVTRLVEEIRDSALTLRMVPVGESLNRFRGLAADMGRELGKEVELAISGGEVELDKSVVEKIADPLMHLVRNAIDHGIESPEERIAAGKPATGRLSLRAAHQSGSVLIEVADDGRGMDVDGLLAKARAAGLVGEDQHPGQQEILRFAFEPGMSTAAQVSNFSGRGVGLDAVRRKVEGLRGSIEVQSERNQGTRLTIRLPMTLSIIDGFRVSVAGLSYVLPLDAVVECIEAEPGTGRQDGRHYINLRGDVLPFVRLRELFGEPMPAPDARENILVVSTGGQKAGLVVDDLLGEYQTVIKPLGKLFRKASGLSGATILGSGEVALILDVPQLISAAMQRNQSTLYQNVNGIADRAGANFAMH